MVEMLRMGANDYCTKPIDLDVLLIRVEKQVKLN